MKKNLLSIAVVGAASFVSLTAGAQTVEASGAAEVPSGVESPSGVASGLMIQARLQTHANPLSLGTGTSFVAGYRGASYALGLGLGLTRFGATFEDDKTSGTLLFAMPTGFFDVWKSADGRARANVVAGLGFGQGTIKSSFESCDIDTCETIESKQKISLLPVALGFGGDYFLGRQFALGAEAGLQGAFAFGVKSTYDGNTDTIDGGGNLQLAYGVIRTTFILGD